MALGEDAGSLVRFHHLVSFRCWTGDPRRYDIMLSKTASTCCSVHTGEYILTLDELLLLDTSSLAFNAVDYASMPRTACDKFMTGEILALALRQERQLNHSYVAKKLSHSCPDARFTLRVERAI